MLIFCFALICLIRSSLAVELYVYKSFTQVREPHNGIGAYKYEFTNADYGNVIDGSISWEGTPFLRQEVYNTITSLQDAQVTVRRATVCGCETIQAKMIDPKSMLLQNLNTGAYFYADKQSIEYTSTRPDDGGIALMFYFQGTTTAHNGTLSYLINGITWEPSYDLFLIGTNDSKLYAYANIKNDQQREYTVDNTYLLGGDVQLATDDSESGPRFESEKLITNLRPIQLVGEQDGLYSYSLKNKYTLRPSSSIRLPFIDITAKYRFYYKASTSIQTGMYQGVFAKNYDLTPNQFMPAGIINIRDNQVLVGQSNLPDVPKNYTQTISVGQDSDVRYVLKGNLTSQSDNQASVSWQTYELNVQVMNFKNKNVDTELAISGGDQITLLNTTCKFVKVNGNQLNLPIQLKQGENRLCKFNVTVRSI